MQLICKTESLCRPPDTITTLLTGYACSVDHSCLTLWPCVLQPSRLLCPRDFLGKNTGVSCHFFLQGSSQLRDQTCANSLYMYIHTQREHTYLGMLHIYDICECNYIHIYIFIQEDKKYGKLPKVGSSILCSHFISKAFIVRKIKYLETWLTLYVRVPLYSIYNLRQIDAQTYLWKGFVYSAALKF